MGKGLWPPRGSSSVVELSGFLELLPAMFLLSFLEATDNTATVDLLISPVPWSTPLSLGFLVWEMGKIIPI